jgi:[acyl-carrier-protein] S-malonyltransferase
MSLALLFPGQGTQHASMLPWLDDQPEAAATLGLMAEQIGSDWRSRTSDAVWATQNTVAQVLMTGLSIGAWQCLAPRLPAPAVIAGYSVGELPAFCVAGVFDARAALHLADERAQAMNASSAGQRGGLLAVSGITPAEVAHVSAGHGLALAIRIAPDRCVLGGPDAALAAAQAELVSAGAQCTPLPVRVASHTPQMNAAAQAFAQLIEPMPFARPNALLVSNHTGAGVREGAALKHALAAQIAATVQWERCIETIAERGVRCVLEVGPGSSLAKIWNASQPHIASRSIDEFQSLHGVLRWVDRAMR